MSTSFDFEKFKAEAIERLKSYSSLSDKYGVLTPLLENLLNSALEGEMDVHLNEEEREMGNRRNGHMNKQVQTSMGEIMSFFKVVKGRVYKLVFAKSVKRNGKTIYPKKSKVLKFWPIRNLG